MSAQPDLFEAQTRRASYTAVLAGLAPRQAEVLEALVASPAGLTAWELADRVHRLVHAVRPRLTELKKRGHVTTCGRRWYAPTARHEAVWQVVRPQ